MKPSLKPDDLSISPTKAEDTLNLSDILGQKRAKDGEAEDLREYEVVKGYDDTVRWPLWKTVGFVITVCLVFWVSVAVFIMYLVS